jgi:hypothetical protein
VSRTSGNALTFSPILESSLHIALVKQRNNVQRELLIQKGFARSIGDAQSSQALATEFYAVSLESTTGLVQTRGEREKSSSSGSTLKTKQSAPSVESHSV